MNAEERHDATIMYLVMPSYAEPLKKEIKQIMLKKKEIYAVAKLFKRFLKALISILLSQTAKTSNK